MVQQEAFFLPAGAGQCFCLYHPPQGPEEKGAVLYIHPFAEEMNKSRRMAALQSRALAAAGFGVLQIDLRGCGDSSGDFGDADWQTWVEDVVNACHWLSARSKAPLWLWGLRAGCLLAVDAAVNLPELPEFHLLATRCFRQATLATVHAAQNGWRTGRRAGQGGR